jgi:hypothetical protein
MVLSALRTSPSFERGDDVELGDVELGDVELGDVELGDVELGDVELGDVELGDVELGDVELGDVELGEVKCARRGQLRCARCPAPMLLPVRSTTGRGERATSCELPPR